MTAPDDRFVGELDNPVTTNWNKTMTGPGRWTELPQQLGVLWTDDDRGLGLAVLPGIDQAAASALRVEISTYAQVPENSASQVFDHIAARYEARYATGDLADLQRHIDSVNH